ncbi:hypothetical protein [Candidatus Pyrohabitans sp.]
MSREGEKHLRRILERRGFIVSEKKNEQGADIVAYKDKLALLIEEKDWRYPVRVWRNRIRTKHKSFGVGQIKRYLGALIRELTAQGKFFHVVPCYVFSCKEGRLVDVIHDGVPVFIVARQYFAEWVYHLERVYLGAPHMERVNYVIRKVEVKA